MERLQLFCQAMNLKIDRIGRYRAALGSRVSHCKREAIRYADRAWRAEHKVERLEAMVLYYLESHDLKQIESDDFTFRRQRNSQDSVIIRNAQTVRASVKVTEPSNTAIKQQIANGRTIEGVEIKRLYHLRVS
jgi:Siphovirus Gp157